MKVTFAQINTTVGDFEGNEAKILDALAKGKQDSADLVIFPELTTTGYPPRDLLESPSFIEQNLKLSQNLGKASLNSPSLVFGFVDVSEKSSGKGLHNAVALAYEGKIQFVQHKSLLPTYDVFDEHRYFDVAQKQHIHSYLGINWGLTICEDIWGEHPFDRKSLYPFNPINNLKEMGSQIIVNISASPYSLGKQKVRRELVANMALKAGQPIFFCNQVGGNDDLVFDGGSLLANAEGQIIFEAARFKEEIKTVDLKSTAQKIIEGSQIEEIEDCLLLGLKDYLRKTGFKKVILGLSGGIDSAVVATLATKALGPENVEAIALPGPFSSLHSESDARELALALGISYKVISINQIYQNFLKALDLDKEKEVNLAMENIQARARGNILMSLSNQNGALLLTTGNKSELACGYCTLYGDMAGGLALISDLPKTKVYELAHFLNKDKEVIPKSTLTKAPSAELRPNQRDQDSLPDYNTLDSILNAYIDNRKSLKEIVAEGFDEQVVRRILKMVNSNEYKRIQSPIGIKVTSKAFGRGRRFPIAWKHN